VEPTLKAYKAIFTNQQIMIGFQNSVIYALLGTAISVTMTILMAFPLSRPQMVGRNIFTWLLVFTMLFSGGLIPTYMVVRGLGLLNTWWAIVLPSAMAPFNVFIARTYFKSLPEELYEAATIDGISDLGHFVRIVLPLSTPIIAVISLFYGVGLWNSYFGALIYLSDDKLFPLQIVLRNILILGNIDMTMIKDWEEQVRKQGLSDLLKYAVIVVASVPVLVFYPLIQRNFVRGMMIGSVKG
jgi:ABC-type glycerol-3-phosphate transport system permease component